MHNNEAVLLRMASISEWLGEKSLHYSYLYENAFYDSLVKN